MQYQVKYIPPAFLLNPRCRIELNQTLYRMSFPLCNNRPQPNQHFNANAALRKGEKISLPLQHGLHDSPFPRIQHMPPWHGCNDAGKLVRNEL